MILHNFMLLSIAGLGIAQFYAVINCWPWYCTILCCYQLLALVLHNFMLLSISGLGIAQFYAVINCWPWYCTILCCYQLLALILHNFMLLSIAGLGIAQFYAVINCWPWYCTILCCYQLLALILHNSHRYLWFLLARTIQSFLSFTTCPKTRYSFPGTGQNFFLFSESANILRDANNLGAGCSVTEFKRPGCEDDHSPPCSAKVGNVCGAIL